MIMDQLNINSEAQLMLSVETPTDQWTFVQLFQVSADYLELCVRDESFCGFVPYTEAVCNNGKE